MLCLRIIIDNQQNKPTTNYGDLFQNFLLSNRYNTVLDHVIYIGCLIISVCCIIIYIIDTTVNLKVVSSNYNKVFSTKYLVLRLLAAILYDYVICMIRLGILILPTD